MTVFRRCIKAQNEPLLHTSLSCFLLDCFGQVEVTYPYNPDGNADTLIGVTDLQDLLVTYGQPFLPSGILIDGQPFEDVMLQLLGTLNAIESNATCDIQLGETSHNYFHELNWIQQTDNGNRFYAELNEEADGILRIVGGNHQIGFVVVPDSVEESTYTNEQVAAEQHSASFWVGERPKHTIPLNRYEKVVLFAGSGALEEQTTSGEMSVFFSSLESPCVTNNVINEISIIDIGSYNNNGDEGTVEITPNTAQINFTGTSNPCCSNHFKLIDPIDGLNKVTLFNTSDNWIYVYGLSYPFLPGQWVELRHFEEQWFVPWSDD